MTQSFKLHKTLCAGLLVLALFGALPVLAAEIHVTSLADSGVGSLRQAINVTALPGDTIVFDVTGTITLTFGELVIDKNLTISGPGAESLAISGNLASRVFRITGGSTVAISGVTIQDGKIIVNVFPDNEGGGIFIEIGGTLTLTNSTLSGNSTFYGGGGGGIANGGTLTVTNSTVSGNSSYWGGGGIANYGTLTLTNSTLSGNSAPYSGGIFNSYATATLKNTIVANSPSGGNCVVPSGPFTSQGHNLSSDGTCAGFFMQPSDMNSTAPLLDLDGLKDNGGPTHTIALLAGSPAIDAIPASNCTDVAGNLVETDQRGVARPQGPACDIGAFELLVSNQPPVANAGPDQTGVVNLSLTFNGSASSDPDGTLVSYQWDFGDYTTASGVTVSHAYSAAGTYTAILTLTDDGGATASDTAQVTIQTPAHATGTLMSEVLALELSRGIEQSLSATLSAALASINQGDQLAKLAALNQLQAFIYQVSALQGIKLTPAEAASLIAAAQQIMQSLSSSP